MSEEHCLQPLLQWLNRVDIITEDDIGMYANVCKAFFPTPTDQGICLTKNMNIRDVIHIDGEYEPLFEPNLQRSGEFVVGTEESENILAFFTGRPSPLSHTWHIFF